MKIEFFNLGTIKHTELDLRPLTVIIGPNNSNKTYLAYSIYGLWKVAGNIGYDTDDIKPLTEGRLLSQNHISEYQPVINSVYQKVVNHFANEIVVFFQDTSGKVFKNTRYEIHASDDDIHRAFSHIPEIGSPVDESVEFKISFYNNVIKFEPANERVKMPDGFSRTSLLAHWRVLNVVRSVLFSTPFLLPAERNALIITYKMLANRRYKMLRDTQRTLFSDFNDRNIERQSELLREQGDIRYPEPIEDFLDALTDIEIGDNLSLQELINPNATVQKNGRAKNEFNSIAALIEHNIQSGNKTEFRQTRLGGKEIVVKVNADLKIDLYNASSSTKQLAPLLLYLRYRAKKNDLLIIDEPEMNLHPESQVKLLEILAILVNSGVNVLLTTHSPYFLAHLNNLAQSDDKPAAVRKRQATSLYLKDPRAFLNMEQVSAYEMKDNELKTLKDPDYGIRWDTLSDISVEVQQKYFEIYEKGKGFRRAKAQRPAQTAQGEKE